MRHIVFVGFEQALLLDIAGPFEVFAAARKLCVARGLPDPYRLSLISPRGGEITTSAGVGLRTLPLAALQGKPIDTLVVVGGFGSRQAVHEATLIGWIAERARHARRVCSVCTGAFLLAEAGLLDGRRAVTHWWASDEMQKRYPGVCVDPDPIFLRDGKIWTSAGVTAGIDLALALVEEDLGHTAALRVARHLVVFLKRPGGQSQFSAMLQTQARDDGCFSELHDWIAQHLADDLRVETLAGRAGMSPRNFARVYAQRTGATPAKAVELLRLEAARRALEETAAPIESIARRCGFGDEERMRRSFLRRLGVPPRQYRSRFSRSDEATRVIAGGARARA
jgi:transcriptional regulator GlxA family with amidase domain